MYSLFTCTIAQNIEYINIQNSNLSTNIPPHGVEPLNKSSLFCVYDCYVFFQTF